MSSHTRDDKHRIPTQGPIAREGPRCCHSLEPLRALLLLGLALSLAVFAVNVVASVSFPFALNYGEPLLVDQALRIGSGESIYRPNLDELPCTVANYPPLYPLLLACFATLGPSVILHIGRLVSLAAALTSAAMIGAFAFRLSGRRFAGLLSATLFLGHPAVAEWSVLARVDLLGLALSLVALWILFTRWRSWCWLAISVICLTAAVYTRQNYVLAVPLAGAAWLYRCERRRAALFLGSLIASIGLLFVVLSARTSGGYYLNTILANLGPFHTWRLLSWGMLFLVSWPIVLAVAKLEILQSLKGVRGEALDTETPMRPAFQVFALVPYAVGSLLSALTIGKVGSDVNYLLELTAALAIWAGIAGIWRADPKNGTAKIVRILMLGQIVWLLVIGSIPARSALRRWSNLPELTALFRRVRSAETQGPILAGDRLDMVVLAGKPIYFEPFGCEQARLLGLWDPSPLIEEIEAERFPLILVSRPGSDLHATGWAPEIWNAVETHYALVQEVLGIAVYEPRADESDGAPGSQGRDPLENQRTSRGSS